MLKELAHEKQTIKMALLGYNEYLLKIVFREYVYMKKQKNILASLFILVLITGACSSEPELDKTKFMKLELTVQEMKTSRAEAASYQHFGDLLQELSTEIAAVHEKTLSKKEMELLNAYSVLAGVYQDGYILWKVKLEFAPFGIVPEGRIYVSQDVEPIVFKYSFPVESHLYKPTQQYWKSISEDSIQIIWNNADIQQKIIIGTAQ